MESGAFAAFRNSRVIIKSFFNGDRKGKVYKVSLRMFMKCKFHAMSRVRPAWESARFPNMCAVKSNHLLNDETRYTVGQPKDYGSA